MGQLLVISSQVARGAVGLGAMLPALTALGHATIALPTVLFSNHPGHATFAGERVDPGLIGRMIDALDNNGWLAGIDAVISGYLPSLAHVDVAASAVARVRRRSPRSIYLCDPVLGDDPKGLYIDGEAAAAIRDRLVSTADVILPNRFELEWLTGRPVHSCEAAVEAARSLAPPWTIATSVPGEEGYVTTLAIAPSSVHLAALPRRDQVPNGTGDLLTGLVAGALVSGESHIRALEVATERLGVVIEASLGLDELQMATALVRKWG